MAKVWEFWTKPEHIVRWAFASEEMQRSGWQAILDNFKKYVEGKK
jgi:uncharacterized protein YndB with AHSA1/START domain